MRLSEAGRGMAGGLFLGAIVVAIALNPTAIPGPPWRRLIPTAVPVKSTLCRHSQRSARTGSIRVARRAGTALARATVALNTSSTVE